MALDPQAKALLDFLNSQKAPPVERLTVEQNRAGIKLLCRYGNVAPAPVAGVEDRMIPVAGGEIGARLYTPEGDAPRPVLVYFHGGGFIMGDLDDWDPPLRELTNAAGCLVVSVAYRLAPEHRFPTAPEDCYRALSWVAENAASLGGDPGRIAVGGDSAGGNLAAVAALMARERGGPLPVCQVLIYPVTDMAGDYPSQHEFGEGYFLTTEAARYFHSLYFRTDEDAQNVYASPLLADLGGLPPALVVTAGYDPLRDQGQAYARKLAVAGVRVDYRCYGGMIHGFLNMAGLLDKGRELIADTAAYLGENLKGYGNS